MVSGVLLKWWKDVQIYALAIFVYPIAVPITLLYWLMHSLLLAPRPKSVAGEVAVVTGGAGGLGKRLCIELAKRGCHIAVVDVNGNDAEQFAKMLREQYKVKTAAYQVDITQRDAVAALKASVTKDLGHTTILINNAGIMLFSNIFEATPRELQRMIDVNLTAHFWTNEIFLPQMRELQRGHIVAVGSVAGLLPIFNNTVYTATKFGVRGLMRSLRLTLKMEGCVGVHTSLVCPLFIKTTTQLRDVIDSLGIDSMYPALSDEEAGRRIVAGILRNEEEIVVPGVFALLYRFLDILPISWQDYLIAHVTYPTWKIYYKKREESMAQNDHNNAN